LFGEMYNEDRLVWWRQCQTKPISCKILHEKTKTANSDQSCNSLENTNSGEITCPEKNKHSLLTID
jgi:hypothetical protein